MTSREAAPGAGPFSFEHTWEMREDDYVLLTSYPILHSRRTRGAVASTALVGIVMLAWPYSAGVGVLVLLAAAFFWRLPRIAQAQARERFGKHQYLHGAVTYGVSRRGIWIRGTHFSAEAGWPAVASWREQGDWLVLSAWGTPPVYLPIGALKRNDLYEPVAALARHHAAAAAADGRRSPPHVN